ncbi:MAG TPA: hypothetical protein VJV79_11110, partial [Polyangiaceae bacterium]|nr:hypothetical protein [Polyangiaceae bacterium]
GSSAGGGGASGSAAIAGGGSADNNATAGSAGSGAVSPGAAGSAGAGSAGAGSAGAGSAGAANEPLFTDDFEGVALDILKWKTRIDSNGVFSLDTAQKHGGAKSLRLKHSGFSTCSPSKIRRSSLPRTTRSTLGFGCA